jgi:L-seryl-tRNA(Ser) seleniumtransferase
LAAWAEPHLRRVLNASGVVIHTNLGRSVLAESAIARVVEAARHSSNLEYDLDAGARGSRHEHVGALLTRLTGAGAAMVVNNNAAAVLLVLAALAAGREVIVSRGQLVEIGGSFRIPDVLRQSGARLVEVGTTNKTRIADYQRAITSETALLLRVHTSNFKVVGFTEEVEAVELAQLGREFGLPVADDLGSGALVALPGFRDEPSVASSLAAGVDVVTFSGDKLLGGPQAGILLGNETTIATLKQHPLARAVRVDKMTLAALEGTLLLYQDPVRALAEIPTLRHLDRRSADTEALARLLLAHLEPRCVGRADLRIETSTGRAGGGSLPLLEIPSHAVAVTPAGGEVAALAAALRAAPLPVVGRLADEHLLLDVLALEEEELSDVARMVGWALERPASPS